MVWKNVNRLCNDIVIYYTLPMLLPLISKFFRNFWHLLKSLNLLFIMHLKWLLWITLYLLKVMYLYPHILETWPGQLKVTAVSLDIGEQYHQTGKPFLHNILISFVSTLAITFYYQIRWWKQSLTSEHYQTENPLFVCLTSLKKEPCKRAIT